MIQVVLEEPGTFTIGEGAEPVAARDEAIVQVERIGVCGTDLHAFHGRHPFVRCPIVLGHELGGTVLSAPENDRGIHPGVRVSVEPFRWCGACPPCRLGKPNCCQKMHVIGVHGDGGMRPRIAVPLRHLHPSEKLSSDQLALVEPLSIGAHAVQRSGLGGREPTLVVGAGPIGLAATQFALLRDADVTVVEVNPARRQWVRDQMGIRVLAEPDDRLYDVVIDATGHPKAMERSFHSVAHGGRLVFVGVIKANISFDDALLHGREMTVLASRNSFGEFPRIISLLEEGRFDPAKWITHRIRLDELPDRFGAMAASAGFVKAMIEVPH